MALEIGEAGTTFRAPEPGRAERIGGAFDKRIVRGSGIDMPLADAVALRRRRYGDLRGLHIPSKEQTPRHAGLEGHAKALSPRQSLVSCVLA